jgi:hypothetical protein
MRLSEIVILNNTGVILKIDTRGLAVTQNLILVSRDVTAAGDCGRPVNNRARVRANLCSSGGIAAFTAS